MFPAHLVSGCRQTLRGTAWHRCLLALAAISLTTSVAAEIQMRDEGEAGIALSNESEHATSPINDPMYLEASDSAADGGLSAALSGAVGNVGANRGIPGKGVTGGNATPDVAAVPHHPERRELASLVSAAAATHGVSEHLITAVIEVESNFNARAVSPKGAIGLMQLMPQTARHLKVSDARDPAANIDAGARYLKELLRRFGNNLHLALAAYNAGPATVRRSGGIPPIAETQRYVPKVMQSYYKHRLQSSLAAAR